MTIFGWDASDYDWQRGPMDLQAARRDGIDFFTHKATEGLATRHAQFGEGVRRARDAGMPFIGAYGVPRSTSSISAQVDFFLSYVTTQAPWWKTYPGWFFQCDLELWPYDKVPVFGGTEWCRLVRERTGRQVLLYAPAWAYGNDIQGDDPLWQSSYGPNPTGHFKALYPGDTSSRWHEYSRRTPVVLQYGSRAQVGSQHDCDANAFRGTTEDFARLIGARHITQGEDMSGFGFSDANEAEALAWRMDAAARGLEIVRDGPAKGEPFQLMVKLNQLGRLLDAVPELSVTMHQILDRLSAPAPVALTDQDRQDIAARITELTGKLRGELRFTAES